MNKKKHTRLTLWGFGLIFASLVAGVGAIGQPVFALECTILPAAICGPMGADPEAPANADVGRTGILDILRLGLRILTAGVGIVAVAAFVYAGVMYTSAGDNSGQVQKAKEIITNAVIGVAAYAFLAVFLNWLIPGGVFG